MTTAPLAFHCRQLVYCDVYVG